MIFDISVIFQGLTKDLLRISYKSTQIEKIQGLFKDFFSLSELRTFQGLGPKFKDFSSPVRTL